MDDDGRPGRRWQAVRRCQWPVTVFMETLNRSTATSRENVDIQIKNTTTL